MNLLKKAISLRGDHYWCPLSLQVDAYWNCLTDCHHCYLRRMNRTWGADLRPADVEQLRKDLTNGLAAKDPKTALGRAIKAKKTIRFGNKVDAYQEADKEYQTARAIVGLLRELDWSFVVQTRFTANVFRDLDLMDPTRTTIMPVISPGLAWDWENLERSRTTHPVDRIKHCGEFLKAGFNVGVNGEPYIGGYHTPEMFRDTIKQLKAVGVRSYNTYFIHLNDLSLKQMHAAGLDIEKIWWHAQDAQWKPIQRKLIEISREEGVVLGCPDFVNSGAYQEPTNTCCGMNVPNPSTFTVIAWKKLWLAGVRDIDDILARTWDGVGDLNEAHAILSGKRPDVFNLKDLEKNL